MTVPGPTTPLQLARRRARQIREMGSALDRPCGYCGAKPNELCRYKDGREITQVDGVHAARLGGKARRFKYYSRIS